MDPRPTSYDDVTVCVRFLLHVLKPTVAYVALAMAATNYYMFNVYDPTMFADADMQKKALEENYALISIVEDAISRFFFL